MKLIFVELGGPGEEHRENQCYKMICIMKYYTQRQGLKKSRITKPPHSVSTICLFLYLLPLVQPYTVQLKTPSVIL